MSSLSERAASWNAIGDIGVTDQRMLVLDMACAIEGLAEQNHALSSRVESMQLRLEELETQVAQLAPKPPSQTGLADWMERTGE